MSPGSGGRRSARRAPVLHDLETLVDLIGLTLNHGLFVVRGAGTLAEAEAILADRRPAIAVLDMDRDDSVELLRRLRRLQHHAAESESGGDASPIGKWSPGR